MNKTEMAPLLMVLIFVPVLKCKAAADLSPAQLGLRVILTPRSHNIQIPNADLGRNSKRYILQDFRGVVNYGINCSQPALPSQPESPSTHLNIPGVSHLVMSLRNIAEELRK